MTNLCNFHFYSLSFIDNNKETLEFDSKGYKKEEDDEIIYYFKHDNNYKFIIKKDILKVEVNSSKYIFKLNEVTECCINIGDYEIHNTINTQILNISNNKIVLEYEMNFDTFKGQYKIILELY